MAVNLVSLVSQFLTPQMVAAISRAIGVDPAIGQKLVGGAIPAVLASLASAATASGGAQKISDAISNADPDLLTKLGGGLAGGGQSPMLSEGVSALGGLIGGGGLSGLAGALASHAGAPPAAAQSAIGAVSQAIFGVVGQQDPSNWSDGASIASMLASQKDAIGAALPAGLAGALNASGLLAGLGGMGAAATAAASNAASAAASRASSAATSAASSASNMASSAANRAQAASGSGGFPMWAIVLIVIIVLAAIYWYMQSQKPAEKPAASGAAAIELALRALPAPRG